MSIQIIPSASPDSPLGAGVVFKNKTFITHSRLPLEQSALVTLVPWQKFLLLSFICLIAVGLLTAPLAAGIAFTALLSAVYFIDMIFSGFLIARSLRRPPELKFTGADLSGLKSADLPLYTILCPLYRESRVLPDFVSAVSALDWPKNKLEVLLLLEEDDHETLETARQLNLPSCFRIITVPHSLPKTKPKACNYGLALARGQYIVIYDAEDRPDPLQLKKAYLGFQVSSPAVACLQAKLNYYNPHQNLLTRLFTAEYSLWFDIMLPGYQGINTCIPLGGTSNHFRTGVLTRLHGWDAFNVTEDCDLGVRLFKHGFKTAIIDSVTLEEANSRPGNWLRQRSRWIKGYLQTWLVHNRRPLAFIKNHSVHALIFQLIIGGKTFFLLINPVLWLATISYFALFYLVGPTIESLYPAPVFYLAGFSAIFGNFLFLYSYMLGLARRGQWSLVKYIFLVPFYWLMVSVASVKAFIQLVFKPYYWEKTHHGLVSPQPVRAKKDHPAFRLPSLPAFPRPAPGLAFPLAAALLWVLPLAYLLYATSGFPPASAAAVSFCLAGYWVTMRLRPVLTSLVNLVRPRLSGSFAAGSVLIFASGLGNLLNFAYNAYLGRQLSPSQFGLISLFSSFFYLTSVPASALARTVTYKSAYLAGKFSTPVRSFWARTLKLVVPASLALSLLWIIATPLLTRVFRSDHLLAFWLFAPVWILTLVGSVNSGFLGGNLKFQIIGLMVIVEAASKFLLAVVLVSLGRQDLVYAALPASLLPGFAAGLWLAARLARRSTSSVPAGQSRLPRRFLTASLLVSTSSLAFLSIDVILAKRFLDPHSAGLYALLSLSGKMVYFAGNLFSQFITPVVSHARGRGESSHHKFYTLLAASAVSGLTGFLAVGVLGRFTVPLLFGAKSGAIISFLPWYTLAMVALLLAGSLVNFHQIHHRYAFAAVSAAAAAAQVFGLMLFHDSISEFVTVTVTVCFLYLAAAGILNSFSGHLTTIAFNFRDFLKLFSPFPRPRPAPAESLRILIFNWYDLTHKWAGGAEIYIHEIAGRWAAAGHQVTMFSGNDQTQKPYEVIDGVRIFRRGGQFTVAFWACLYYLFRFRGRFDVIIDIPKGVPFFTPLYTTTPVICLVHQVHQEMFRSELKFPLKQLSLFLEARAMPFVYRHVHMIAVSPSTKSAVVGIGMGQNGPIDIVYPGVDIRPASVPKTSYPSVIYLGRLRPYKFVDHLLVAVSRLKSRIPNLRLTVAGTGEDAPRLKSLAEKLNLGRSVTFTGRVSDADRAKLFTQSWVAVQPSMVEGWGITNIEANACGTPVVAADVDGLRDSVVHNDTGLLFPPADPAALADALQQILTDKGLRTRLAKNAVPWSQKFSWAASSDQFLSIIQARLTARVRPVFTPTPALASAESI